MGLITLYLPLGLHEAGALGPFGRSGIGGPGNHVCRFPHQHAVSLRSAIVYTGGSGGELEKKHGKEKLLCKRQASAPP